MGETMTIETAECEASDFSPTKSAREFAAEWRQIHEDLKNADECALRMRKDLKTAAECALRIGQNLIKVRDALKPFKRWLPALQEQGMSPTQAWRYTQFAEQFGKLSEPDREIFLRSRGKKAFSLTEAIGGIPRKRKDADEDPGARPTNGPAIPEDELGDRLAEIDQRFKLAIRMIEAGQDALTSGEQPPEYADDTDRWTAKVAEVAEDVRGVIEEHLMAELKKRLLPC